MHRLRAMLLRMLCRFAVGEGDLITFLNIWKGWEDSGRSRKWCYKNFVNHHTMLRAADIRNQLQRHVRYLIQSPLSLVTGERYLRHPTLLGLPPTYTAMLAMGQLQQLHLC